MKLKKAMVDVIYVIDSTGSMKAALQAVQNKVEDISFEIGMNFRNLDFQYGSVCYRDHAHDPTDKNEIFQLNKEIENLSIFLSCVKAQGGGGDGPEDWVSACDNLFNDIKWRENSKRVIVWIADYWAHGKKYSGRNEHDDQIELLDKHVQRLAKENYYFIGIALKKHARYTFNSMKKDYVKFGGKSFEIKDFTIMKNMEQNEIDVTLSKTALDGMFVAFQKISEE